MPKPDPALLDPARYPYHLDVPTRFGDLDTNNHINNVAMSGMFEDARVRFHLVNGYMASLGPRKTMIASFAIDYLGQAYFPDPLEFHVGVEAMGRTSHTIVQLALQHGQPVALARSIVVCTLDGRPDPLPEDVSAGIRQWLLRP